MDKNELVLIVDDETDCREVLRMTLELFKVRVIEAEDGFDGCNLAVAQHQGLIFMDLNMPKMDGLQTTRAIRAHPDAGHIPVVAMSADDARVQKLRALEAGCVEWLQKPWELRELF